MSSIEVFVYIRQFDGVGRIRIELIRSLRFGRVCLEPKVGRHLGLYNPMRIYLEAKKMRSNHDMFEARDRETCVSRQI